MKERRNLVIYQVALHTEYSERLEARPCKRRNYPSYINHVWEAQLQYLEFISKSTDQVYTHRHEQGATFDLKKSNVALSSPFCHLETFTRILLVAEYQLIILIDKYFD